MILVEATNVYENFTGMTMKAVLVGVTQIVLLAVHIFAVAENISRNMSTAVVHGKRIFTACIIASVMQASYAVGVSDMFQNT